MEETRLARLFAQLVSIDSPSRGERQMCDTLSSFLTGLGLSPQEDDAGERIGGTCGNLYTFVPGTLALPPLLFCAHMDTVEPSRGKRAIFHGDGTVTSGGDTVLGADDCAGIAAILEALTVLRQSGLPHRPLEDSLFTAAEEPYCLGARAFDFSRLRSQQAYVFDLTGPVGQAAYRAPTILTFQLRFCGRSAHAGFSPELGSHAIKAAGAAIAAIPCGRIGGATVNLGVISGGTADNIVPALCTLTGEIRSLEDAEAKQRMEELSAAAHRAARQFGGRVEITCTEECTAYTTAPEHGVVKRFERACSTLGLTPQLCQTFGGSDNNALARHKIAGIVVATAMQSCHTCQEFTAVDELTRAAALALACMRSTQ